MPLLKYIKQPLSPSLGQYTDAELRKIEASIFNLAENADSTAAALESLTAAVAGLVAQAWSVSAMKPSDQSIASDNTVNVDPDLVIPLTPGLWDIELGIIVISAFSPQSIALDLEFTGTISNPGVNCVQGLSGGNTGPRVYDSVLPHTPGGSSTMAFVANIQKTSTNRAYINVLTAGDLALWWSQGASNATPVILRAGSFLRGRQIA